MRKYIPEYRRPPKSPGKNDRQIWLASTTDDSPRGKKSETSFSRQAVSDPGIDNEQNRLKQSAHDLLYQQEKYNKKRSKKKDIEVWGLPQIKAAEDSRLNRKNYKNDLLMFQDEADESIISGWSKTELLQQETKKKGSPKQNKKNKRSLFSIKSSSNGKKSSSKISSPKPSASKGTHFRLLSKNLNDVKQSSIPPPSPMSKTSLSTQTSTPSSINNLSPIRKDPLEDFEIKSIGRLDDEDGMITPKINASGLSPTNRSSPMHHSSKVPISMFPFDSYHEEIRTENTKKPPLPTNRRTMRDQRNNITQQDNSRDFAPRFPPDFPTIAPPTISPQSKPQKSMTQPTSISSDQTESLPMNPIRIKPPKPISSNILLHEDMELNEAGGISQILDSENEVSDSHRTALHNVLGKSRGEMVSLATMTRNLPKEKNTSQTQSKDESEHNLMISEPVQKTWLQNQHYMEGKNQESQNNFETNERSRHLKNHDLVKRNKSSLRETNDKSSPLSVAFDDSAAQEWERGQKSSWSSFSPNHEQDQADFHNKKHSVAFGEQQNVYHNDDNDSQWLKNQSNDMYSFTSHGFSHVSDPRTWEKRESLSNTEQDLHQRMAFMSIPKNIEKKVKHKDKIQKDHKFTPTLYHLNKRTQKVEKITKNLKTLSTDSSYGSEQTSSPRKTKFAKNFNQSLFDSIDSSMSQNESSDSVFLSVVASVVIQTYVRRYLALNEACKRYSAVLVIQSFYRRHVIKKRREKVNAPKSSEEIFRSSATLIQATFRGWWARDCLSVDNYCANLIQRNVRRYFCHLNYQYDLYCITIVQSAVRRFIVRRRMNKERLLMTRAATKIQSIWRMYDTSMNFIHFLADILIVQSVARRWIAMRLIRPHLTSSHIGATQCVLSDDFSKQPYNRLLMPKKKKYGSNTKDLLRAWKSRGDEVERNIESNGKHPRRARISKSQIDNQLFGQSVYRKYHQ